MKMLAGCLCVALLCAGSARAGSVENLIKDLKSKDSDVRRTAARELGRLGADAKSAVPALAAALRDSDVYVRRFSALSLGAIGTEARSAVPALARALKDRSKRVAEAAATALGKMGGAGVKPLTDILKDTSRDPAVRTRAVESLGKIGADATEAVPTLVEILEGKPVKDKKGKTVKKPKRMNMDSALRMEVVVALGNIGPGAKEARKVLEEIAANRRVRDRTFKRAVREALRKIK